MLVFIMMAIGLNIVVGYAGLLDLGYVAFYAIGAYTVAWFASVQFARHNVHFLAVGVGKGVPGFHISIWLLLPAAGILTALAGVLIGLPTLRLRGDYLAIVTLGFGEILPQVARNGDSLFNTGFNLTNGPNGITPIDAPGFFGVNFLTGGGSAGPFHFNVSVFILCMVILGGMGNILGVVVGAAFLAYLDREGLANIGGWINQHFHANIDVPKYEFGIFGIILLVVMLFRPEGLIPSS